MGRRRTPGAVLNEYPSKQPPRSQRGCEGKVRLHRHGSVVQISFRRIYKLGKGTVQHGRVLQGVAAQYCGFPSW